MSLFKYTGTVYCLTIRNGVADTVTLYNSGDESVAPVRLDVRGALANYLREFESTDEEERYMPLNWYFDFNMLLRRIEVPGHATPDSGLSGFPAKVVTQSLDEPDELIWFGPHKFINELAPLPMDFKDRCDWFDWKKEHKF